LFTWSSPGLHCHCYKFSPFQAHWERWHCTSFLRPACLFTVHMGSVPSPLSCGVFLPLPLLQASLLLVAGHVPPPLPSPAGFWGISPPPLFGTQGTPPSLLHVFLLLLLIIQFLFLPWVKVGLSRGLCWSSPGLSVGVWHTA
jgi:hypothetical protein